MVSVTTVLVLACAVAINAHALKDGPCTRAYNGDTSGHSVKLPTTYLPPGSCDWEVKIPDNVPGCPYGIKGAIAHVCDTDVAPSAQFIRFDTLFVHRNGQCLGFATVDITVYCKDSPYNHQQPYASPENSQGVATLTAVPRV